jgi:hypothetical protein
MSRVWLIMYRHKAVGRLWLFSFLGDSKLIKSLLGILESVCR